MKKTLAALMAIAALVSNAHAVEVEANTRFLNLTNWAYKDDAGPDMLLYNVAGFYVGNVPLASQRVFLLPSIRYSTKSVQFVDRNGNNIENIATVNASQVETVEITLWYNGNLPTKEQAIGIMSQLGTTTPRAVPRYLPFNLDFFSNPNYLTWGLSQPARNAIQADLNRLAADSQQAETLFATWQSRSPSVVNIKEVTIRAKIDGEVVGEVTEQNALAASGDLPKLYLKGLTDFQINRIKNHGLELLVDYTFRDQKTSSINARFDFRTIMNRVIDDSYRRVTSRRTSGYQFLGMGSRKSTMKDRITQTLTDQTSGGSNGQTMIQMDDANETQIEMFTERFFPTLSQARVVENHIQAAAQADADGKKHLAEAHRKFAADVQNDRLDLNVDTKAALEALNREDYVGFIAHGLKIGSASNKGTFEYHRVLNASSNLVRAEDWVHQMNTQVNRTVTQLVRVRPVERRPFIGTCLSNSMRLNLWIKDGDRDWYPAPQARDYFVPFCLIQNAPLANAGIVPGTLIETVDGRRIANVNDMRAVLANKKPGDVIPVVKLVEYLDYRVPGGVVFQREKVDVELAAGDITQQYQ